MSILTHNHYKEFWAEKSLLASLAVVSEWRKRARAREELSHLTERDARDIGLTAAQVEFEASKPFWQA
ncbi:MAG: hypothetical protein K0S54_1581 [Alphaproteobacteria bacterium]|jgi:uncharacterized protein YjiS (DUF1127 family)|nr:hypothetical protein [Alphaproteobacteria bacterium]